jgi:hypothetical protein
VNSQSQHYGEPSIALAGSVLGNKRHIAGLFCNLDEQYDVLLPFIKEGFDRRENAIHVVNPTLKQDHAKRLMAAGIDIAEAEKTGQYQLRDWDEVYLCDGCFDQDRMLNTWKNLLDPTGSKGSPRTRLVAQMEWALEDRDGAGDLLEYEARFNNVHRESSDPVICVYDLSKFSADVIADALRTHPMVIMGGVLQENPLYTPPEEFLREFLGRRLKYRQSRSS